MDTEFKFDLKQWNTLKTSGLAAYVQHPPPERIGWVLVQGRWLPDWTPKKWVMQVDHLEVTFDSLVSVENYAASEIDWDFEPFAHLMFTAHTRFFTEDLARVEAFFAQYTNKAEFVRPPSKVECPRWHANGEYDPCPYPLWNRDERVLVEVLLNAQRECRVIVWDDWRERLQGRVTAVNWRSADLLTRNGKKTIWFEWGQLVKYARDLNPLLWIRGQGSNRKLSELPIWSFAEERWVVPPESDE